MLYKVIPPWKVIPSKLSPSRHRAQYCPGKQTFLPVTQHPALVWVLGEGHEDEMSEFFPSGLTCSPKPTSLLGYMGQRLPGCQLWRTASHLSGRPFSLQASHPLLQETIFIRSHATSFLVSICDG